MMRTGGIFLKKKTKTLLTVLAVPLGVGAVSGFLTQGSMVLMVFIIASMALVAKYDNEDGGATF